MSTASADTERRSGRARPGDHPRRVEGWERLRVLLAGALGAVLLGYALLVPVAALLLASGGAASVEGSFAVAIPLWLAAHLIPVELDGRPLGVLPLLPTIVVVLVVAAASTWSVRRLGGRLRHDAGAVVAGQAGAAATVAVLAGALLPGDVGVATPWASMVGAGLLAGLGATAGVLRACGLPPDWARRLHGWPRAAITGARAGATGLVLAGSLVLLLATAVRAGDVAASFASLAPDAGAGAGVLLLAVGYLPNALAAGASWSLGAGLAVGPGEYGPFGTVAGPLPPFPLVATLSPEPAPAWTALVLLLPLATGVVVGRVCRRVLGGSAPLRDRLAAAGAAALATAAGVAVIAWLAGGSLAGGPYDPVSLSPAAAGAAALLLLGAPATVACAGADELLGRPPARSSRTRRTSAGAVARRRSDGAPGRDRSARPERSHHGRGDRTASPDGAGTSAGGYGADERGDELDPAVARRSRSDRERPNNAEHGLAHGEARRAWTDRPDHAEDGRDPIGTPRTVTDRAEIGPGPGERRRPRGDRPEHGTGPDPESRPRTVGDLVAATELAARGRPRPDDEDVADRHDVDEDADDTRR